MKCKECNNLLLTYKDNTCYARCVLSNPPKQGKVITWACTTYKSASILDYHKSGHENVIATLEKKIKPIWCKGFEPI